MSDVIDIINKVYDSTTDTVKVQDSSNYAIIIDDTTTANITYFCYAAIGSSVASAVWRIKIIDETSGYPVTKWADGDSNFDNVASNRVALSYS